MTPAAGCLLVVPALACAAAAPARPPAPASSPPVSAGVGPRTDLAAPATLMLLPQSPLAMAAYMYERSPVARLEDGAVGYIDLQHARARATLSEVRRISGPPNLESVCVAEDGRTTFAVSQAKDEETKVWRGERFDAPMELVGVRPTGVGNGSGSQRARWVVQSDSGAFLVECQAGRVQRLGARAVTVGHLRWTDAIHLLRFTRDPRSADTCVLRTAGTDTFTELPSCYERVRADGSIAIEKMPPETPKPAPGQKPPPPVCLLALDRAGNKLPCTAPVGDPPQVPPSDQREHASLARARFHARGSAVVPGANGGLYRLGAEIALDPKNRIGAASLGSCTPLLAIEPVFWCRGDAEFDVVVRVDADATVVPELRRRRAMAQHAGQRIETRFHHTLDGGLAVGGDCEGRLADAACVRDRAGAWHTVPFSPTLITALARTAPATRLIPSPDGRLYVGTGTADPGFALGRALSEIRILIFDAAQGEPVSVKKLPSWIVQELAALVDAPGGADGGRVDLGFAGDRRLRVWPFERQHPAFGTVEHCRVDITFDGAFETTCTQGRLFASGPFGLLQKQVGELYETVDAGGTWTRIALPAGLETDDIACTPLGCRIGPYWRAGWREPAR